MLLTLLTLLFYSVQIAIIGNVLISWVPSLRANPLGRVIHQAGDAILRPFQHLLSSLGMGGSGLDFSPVVALNVVQLVYQLLAKLLYRMGD